jgi:hypothetical protein
VEGAETVVFGLDGSHYEIDVCEQHAGDLRDAFAPYVGGARRAGRAPAGAGAGARRGRSTGRAAAATTPNDRQRVQDIRQWARDNGHQVSERGRLSATVVEAYEAAH